MTHMECVLTDIDADDGNRTVETSRHGVLRVVGAPSQIRSLAGQERGRTIPLADTRRPTILFHRCKIATVGLGVTRYAR